MLSHRARLTLAAATSSGLLFLAFFSVAWFWLRDSELKSAHAELQPALAQAAGDLSTSGKADLAEIVQSNPQISIEMVDLQGQLVERQGPQISSDLVSESRVQGSRRIVASLPWAPHAQLLGRFLTFCAFVWAPLVAIVAVATWLAARSTFRPLQRLAMEAEAMSTEDLSHRLETESSGELAEFSQRLNRFLDRIEASVKREERFLSDAAHELRTPLAVMQVELESAVRTDPNPVLAILLEETARLTRLVDLLLQSAAPDRSGESIDVHEALESAHARWVERFTRAGVRLEYETVSAASPLTAAAWQVVMDNLMANALRVSPPSTTCNLAASIASDSIEVRVIDHGPGIAEADRERIFDRFARVDDGRNRAQGGFGIGLALSRRVVEGVGGVITVEQMEAPGATFLIRLRRL